jgi:protein SCO1/2
MKDIQPREAHGWAAALERGFESWIFPWSVLGIIMTWTSAQLAALLLPDELPWLGRLPEQLKIWCFGYDPATGALPWAAVAVMSAAPLILGGTLLLMWREPLRTGWREHRRQLPLVGLTQLLAALALGATLLITAPPAADSGELPFPAEALRVALDPPRFVLEDQRGLPVTLEALRGKIVILTAIYASCGTACPAMLVELRRALNALPAAARERVVVVAITLDPRDDTAARRAESAASHQLEAPRFLFVGGAPHEVEPVLDALSISRQRDPETGRIDHAALFYLIDPRGKIVYRLQAGDPRRSWLTPALRALLGG